MAETRYACVINGVIVAGPGPLPYRQAHPDGNFYELHALTAEQRLALGWQEVEQRNIWPSYDPDIWQQRTTEVLVEQGRPVENYSYGFTPGARAAMIAKVDTKAEDVRALYITPAPGQVMEYDEADRQASLALAAHAAGQPLSEGDYPFLDADVGFTDNPLTGGKVQTLLEAAQVIKGMRAAFADIGAAIRKIRLENKARLRDAPTVTDAWNIYSSIIWPG